MNPQSTLICGDALATLRTLPAGSAQCCVTSPPYWNLRDYGHAEQLGRERNAADYIGRLVEIMREVRRVLRDDGTLWLNLGDTYAAGQLAGIPWQVALALKADGWRLRSDVIWHKPCPIPESVRDRCTRAHEYVFMLAKAKRYKFNAKAIGEPYTDGVGRDRLSMPKAGAARGSNEGQRMRSQFYRRGFRNRRTVWTIKPRPYPGAHGAVMPPDLVRLCILAGSDSGDTVLDPFAGSGTTLAVAHELGRDAVGIELNEAYVKLMRQRINQAAGVA
jgi:DNA modification methylase